MGMSSRPWPHPIQNIASLNIRVSNIKQTIRRDMEGRETICNIQPMRGPIVFSFHIPINILISQVTAWNHILDHLIVNINGDLRLCSFMANNIYSYARRLAASLHNGFLVSVDTEVLWTDFIEEIMEAPMNISEWLRTSAMHPHYQHQDHHHHHHHQDQEDQDSEGVIEKLRRERRFEGNDGDELGNCAICLDDMSASKDLIDMPCHHIFHDSCIFRWLENHTTCPMCRRVVY